MSSSKAIRVFVAESSRVASELIETALNRSRQGFEVQALSIGSSETIRELQRIKPDVTVLSSDLDDNIYAESYTTQ